MAYQYPLNGGRINASIGGNSTSAGAGYSLISTGTVLLAGGNNITLSQNGSAITISGANAPSGSINFSASNASANLASVSFSNSNGVSFGLNAGVITASHNGISSQSNQAMSASNGSFAFQTAGFSNANGVTFGTSAGSIMTASVNTSYAASNHSHGNPTLNLTNLSGTTASASNGFTLSLSAAAQTAQTQSNIQGIIASGSTNRTGDISFANGNGVTFGLSNNTLTASVLAAGGGGIAMYDGVASISSGTARISAGGALTASINGQTLSLNAPAQSSISGTGIVSISRNGSTISIGAPAFSMGMSNIGNTSGTSGTISNQMVFAGGNNITLSQSTGIGGNTLSISAASQTVQTQNRFNMTLSGNTTGTMAQISSGTLNLAGGSNITLSQNGNSVTIIGGSSGGGSSITDQTLYVSADGAQTTGWRAEAGDYTRVDDQPTDDGDTTRLYSVGANDEASFNIDNTVGITGTVNSVIVHAVVKSLDPVSSTFQIFVRVGGTNYYSDTKDTVTNNTTYVDFTYTWTTNPATSAAWTASEINSLEIGVKKINTSGQRLTQMFAVVNATTSTGGGGAAFSAGISTQGNTGGTTGFATNQIMFAGGNNITLSQATGSAGNTLSIIGGAGGGGLALANSQTTYTSGTANLVVAGGAMTIASTTGQSYNFSVPATSSLSATGAVSVSTNGSTVYIGAPSAPVMTRWEYPNQNINTINQLVSGGTISVQHIFLPAQLSAGSFRVGASVNPVTFSSATTQNWSLSLRAAIYTLNASTLSLLTSNSSSYAYTWGSSTAQTSNFNGIREMSMPFPVNVPAGDYWVGLQISTVTGYATGAGASMNLLGVNSSAMGIFGVMAPFGVNSTSGKDILMGQGFYTSASIPSSIALSAITNGGASQMMRAAFYHAFYDATY